MYYINYQTPAIRIFSGRENIYASWRGPTVPYSLHRPCDPIEARRRAGIWCVAALRRWHRTACVSAPCICPPGARVKM